MKVISVALINCNVGEVEEISGTNRKKRKLCRIGDNYGFRINNNNERN